MTNSEDGLGPLWIAMEEKISELGSPDLSGAGLEAAIQKVAGALDSDGFNVSKNGGHMLELRKAMDARATVGRALIRDLNEALGALSLDDVKHTYQATLGVVDQVGEAWPSLKEAARRPHVLEMVENTRLDLLVAKASELPGDQGVRLLIAETVDPEVIAVRMGISSDDYDKVKAAVDAEAAEAERVVGLLAEVEGKDAQDQVKHLINSNVADDLIFEMGGFDQTVIDGVKKSMEEEILEKKRLEEEAAAKKAAEAAGPALDDIPADEMLEHIEAIREILDFSDVEKEIRVMCGQSGVPQALADIAVSDPDKLDELEAQAEG